MGRPRTGQTTPRAVRIPDALWDQALATARARGESVSDVVRESLREYVASGGARTGPRSRKRRVAGGGPRSSDPAPRIPVQEPRDAP